MHIRITALTTLFLLTACTTPEPLPLHEEEASVSSVTSVQSEPTPQPPANIYDPSRITKKPFGLKIDPETSPVQPERFSGYHTGADFEVLEGEDETTIDVTAICSGPVIQSRTVNGYGGVLVQRCSLEREDITVLYGHLAPSSLVAVGTELIPGDVIGRLGKGFSSETDGERPHLHLSVHKGSAVELRGYVQTEADLGAWMDPLPLLP